MLPLTFAGAAYLNVYSVNCRVTQPRWQPSYMARIICTILLVALCGFTASGQTRKDSLYVFVGKKISVEGFKPVSDHGEVPFNASFKARYVILQQVYGHYDQDSIEFEVYDHYGIPAFSAYDHVLLYVSNVQGTLIHEKYQYADVYKTRNGRWASGYRVGDYDHPYNQESPVRPERIEFAEEVSYPVSNLDTAAINQQFPAPYYRIAGGRAIVVMGNYVEELFALKQTSILKARGIF